MVEERFDKKIRKNDHQIQRGEQNDALCETVLGCSLLMGFNGCGGLRLDELSSALLGSDQLNDENHVGRDENHKRDTKSEVLACDKRVKSLPASEIQ